MTMDPTNHAYVQVSSSSSLPEYERRRRATIMPSNWAILEEQIKSNRPLLNDKSTVLSFFEIDSKGKLTFKDLGLRSLSNYINLLINLIDQHGAPAAPPNSGQPAKANKDDASATPKERKVVRRTSVHNVAFDVSASLSPLPPARSREPSNKQAVTSPQDGLPAPTSSSTKLSHRDIRRLDWKYHPSKETWLLVRRHCILLSMHPLRAIIMAKRVFLLAPSDKSDEGLFLKLLVPLQQAMIGEPASTPITAPVDLMDRLD